MKFRLSYFAVAMLLAIILLCACDKNKKPKINWSVALKRDGKNPYDTRIAYQSIAFYFPDKPIVNLYANYNFEKIGLEDYNSQEGKSMVVLLGKSIIFSQYEWSALQDYMKRGNELIILSSDVDEKILHDMKLDIHKGLESFPLTDMNSGSSNMNALSLEVLPEQKFGIWGRDLKGYFIINDTGDKLNSLGVEVENYGAPKVLGKVHLAVNKFSMPNIVQYAVGEGHLTLVATPLVLSNYFLLQKENHLYADLLWQSIPKDIHQIYWGNYTQRVPDQSSFSILWRNPATRWALILIFIAAAAYLLFEIKRRQRIIPVMATPENSSAAFIETVGILYYNKGDNLNIARKMEQHFLDWVRTKFNINTNILNETFAQQLSIKSGVSLEEVTHLMNLLHQLHLNNDGRDEFLFELYYCINQFYKKN